MNDPELNEAILWMNDNGLTSFKTVQEYKPFDILLREQAAKILYLFANIFQFGSGIDATLTNECTFKDIGTAESSLVSSIENACKS